MTRFRNYPRQHVPADFDSSNWQAVEAQMRRLLDQEPVAPEALRDWLESASELSSVIGEYGARRYIDKSCNTADAEVKKRYFQFVEEIEPKLKPLDFELQKRYLDNPHRHALERGPDGAKYRVLSRQWQADVDLFRPENVPLQTQETKLASEYDELCGAMSVEFRGEDYTLQQMARFSEETDRQTRQQAWEATAKRRMQDRDKIEDVFDQLLEIRQTIARNAGFDNYRDYQFKSLKRFDYTPDDCFAYADAVERAVVPLVRELDEQRRVALDVDTLRPWDLAVDPKGRPPLRPFDQKDIDGFVNTTHTLFETLDPELGEDFDVLRRKKHLDLASRKNKQPGGYQSTLNEAREPFIFMNAAGMQSDVTTLLHEGGHAFHALAARDEPLVFLRQAPMEFCEVASMSIELLALPHYDLYYPDDPAAADRARRRQLEGLSVLTWIAIIDGFQHWIYTHPGHSRDERTAQWLTLLNRFNHDLDWSGHEQVRATTWHRQLHLFHVPFYYIEYGIAQLGALQIYVKAKTDPKEALAGYRRALALGGTRPLSELFEAAGITFDFSEKTIAPLIEQVRHDLATLPV